MLKILGIAHVQNCQCFKFLSWMYKISHQLKFNRIVEVKEAWNNENEYLENNILMIPKTAAAS